mgnify:CR=1 FL=1
MEYIETTFEHQYLLKNKKGGDCQPVWWMCPKGNFEEDPHAKSSEIYPFSRRASDAAERSEIEYIRIIKSVVFSTEISGEDITLFNRIK